MANRSMFFRALCPLAAAVFLATALAGPAPARGAAVGPFGPEEAEELARDLADLAEKHRIPAAAVALVSADGILWAGGLGSAGPEWAGPVTAHTLFRVGSISKTLTALAILRQVEQGRLDLNAPVSELLPEVEIVNPWHDTDPVRLVHLLEHTAGIEDQHFHDVYNLDDPSDLALEQVLAKNPRARRVRWRPGTRVAYSNLGYTLAGCILERATGLPFETYLQDSVLAPLGLAGSTFRVTDEVRARLIPGHTGPGEPAPFRQLYQRPASGLVSTAADLSRVVQLLLNRGRIEDRTFLRPASVDRMETPRTSTAARAGFDLGYGLGNRAGFRGGVVYHGHGGGLPEYTSIIAYVPETGRGCVVLTNTGTEGMGALFRRVFRHVAEAGDPPPAVALTRTQLHRLAGYYQHHNSERRLDAMLNILLAGTTISVEGDTLYRSEAGDAPVPLIPVSPTTFRREGETAASLVFTETADGALLLAEPASRAEYARTGAWRPLAWRALIGGAAAVLVSALLYALFWIPAAAFRRLAGRRPALSSLRVRLVPLLAVAAFLACFVLLSRWGSNPQMMGQPQAAAVGFFLATLTFALLSLLNLVVALAELRKPGRRFAAGYALLVSSAAVGLAAYLWYWDIIGLRLWAY